MTAAAANSCVVERDAGRACAPGRRQGTAWKSPPWVSRPLCLTRGRLRGVCPKP